MKIVKLAVLGTLVLLASALPASSGPKEEDSLFGSLSSGVPAARELGTQLVADSDKMLQTLIKAAAHKGTDKSKSVDLWDGAISEHMDAWDKARGEMADAFAAARKEEAPPAEGEPRKLFPPDWRKWSEAQVEFYNALLQNRFIDWRYGVNVNIEAFEEGLVKDPKKFKELVDQMKWVNEEISDSDAKLSSAKSKADVEKELRRFTRIWTVVNNVEYVVKDRQKFVKAFFADDAVKVDSVKKGFEDARTWFQQWEAKPLLDPMCKHAATAFAVQAAYAVEAYEKKYDELLKMNQPILEETLFDDIPIFKGAKFELKQATRAFEQSIHARLEDYK